MPQVHIPLTHDWPAGHTTPQRPQLVPSVSGLVHPTPVQKICPVIEQVHALARHTWLPGHALPHIPQLFVLVTRSTHELAAEQNVWPVVGQRQAPATQVSVGLQRRSHAPQLAASVCRFTQLPEQLV